ncbi:MAG: hypothetical protein KME30_18910 [Iphinoe sp. HA4291-MV1]|nr:hypothetical protein [Iphinoe sp. HA4291-MV1]
MSQHNTATNLKQLSVISYQWAMGNGQWERSRGAPGVGEQRRIIFDNSQFPIPNSPFPVLNSQDDWFHPCPDCSMRFLEPIFG